MDPVATPGWVEAHIAHSVALWKHSEGPWAYTTAPRYTAAVQELREKAYDRALAEVRRIARSAARSDPDGTERRLVAAFGRFGGEALDLSPAAVDLLTHHFLPAGTQLTRWAHRFDPLLANAALVQACRNAWTACGLQPLLGAPIRLTAAILAYSLLYPYTDNYLDQPTATRAQMLTFSTRFRMRLEGEMPPAINRHEGCVWQMVRLIENDFPRAAYPQVYASLVAIHDAQVRSVSQLDGLALGENEILGITVAKGGTSVLADAALVCGSLNEQQATFAFLWGVLLQLGDDLQDVHEDLARGSDTVFTRAVRAGATLDGLVAQLLNFSDSAAAEMDLLPHGNATHKALLRMSWRSLILMAVAHTNEFFSAPFLADMEARSPFRFAFLRSRCDKLHGNAGLFERLFEILLNRDAPYELPSSLPAPSPVTFKPGSALQAIHAAAAPAE